LGLAVALSLTAGGLLAVPADAEGAADAESIEAAAAANAAAGQPGIIQEVTTNGTSAELDGGAAEVSTDPADGLTVTDPAGTDISLGVPGEPTDGTIVVGNVVYPDVADDASVVARSTQDGAQALVVIDGDDAPERYTFPVEVNGQNAELRHGNDGGIEIFAPKETTPVATIASPWATDANGADVPTHYEIRSSSVVQVVDHRGAAYPVTADPTVSLGWKIYVKYRKSEVHRIASNPLTAKLRYTAAICVAIPNAVAAASCGFYVYDSYSSVSNTFESADRKKRCVEMQYLYSGLLVGWKSYSC
jgi:hypothetical protein